MHKKFSTIGGLILSISILVPSVSEAASAWYRGVVSRVVAEYADGSFFITLESTALNDCEFTYAYFMVPQLGAKRVANAYALALVSLTTGRKFGVVLDKNINGPGGRCEARGQTAEIQ